MMNRPLILRFIPFGMPMVKHQQTLGETPFMTRVTVSRSNQNCLASKKIDSSPGFENLRTVSDFASETLHITLRSVGGKHPPSVHPPPQGHLHIQTAVFRAIDSAGSKHAALVTASIQPDPPKLSVSQFDGLELCKSLN